MRKFRLLKDSPEAKAGQIYSFYPESYKCKYTGYHLAKNIYATADPALNDSYFWHSADIVENNPEWFEEVVEIFDYAFTKPQVAHLFNKSETKMSEFFVHPSVKPTTPPPIPTPFTKGGAGNVGFWIQPQQEHSSTAKTCFTSTSSTCNGLAALERAWKIIYICGAITNDPDYFGKFQKAYIHLKQQKYKNVVNPARAGKSLLNIFEACKLGAPSWWSHMIYDMLLLCRCNTIYMLKNWKISRGARIEHAFMKWKRFLNNNVEIFYEK
ncbi:MAG: DUF4406 domain-containing protein [Candidatus Kapabacteria bacterium]|nr:DUF4406 domain-containing protein [Candidatus Kapabacteria bacterium]